MPFSHPSRLCPHSGQTITKLTLRAASISVALSHNLYVFLKSRNACKTQREKGKYPNVAPFSSRPGFRDFTYSSYAFDIGKQSGVGRRSKTQISVTLRNFASSMRLSDSESGPEVSGSEQEVDSEEERVCCELCNACMQLCTLTELRCTFYTPNEHLRYPVRNWLRGKSCSGRRQRRPAAARACWATASSGSPFTTRTRCMTSWKTSGGQTRQPGRRQWR